MIGELAWLAASVMVAGVVTGILAGLFGIGGGAVIVPVLFEVFRVLGVPEAVRMQLCIGTSMAIIVPNGCALLPRAQGARARASGGHAPLGAAIGGGCRRRVGSCRGRARPTCSSWRSC